MPSGSVPSRWKRPKCARRRPSASARPPRRVAVAEERARIARELPETLAEDRDALLGVERAGRAALAEMRRLLGAMHDDGDGVEFAPQPGLDRLDALAENVRRAGLPVRLHVEGDAFPLPRAIDLSAYRIVQEGLTNSLKHAGASYADVTVRYSSEGVQLQVRDDGVGSTTSDGLGHGLVGMRERVKIYGGEMSAGTAPDGGFVLDARLPLDRYRA
jgi:signal transduction histidine kinase